LHADRIAVEDHVAGVRLDEAHQKTRRRRFSATRLADNTQRSALGDAERDIIHRMHGAHPSVQQPTAHRKMLAQALDDQQRLSRSAAVARVRGERELWRHRASTLNIELDVHGAA
jgi:hypothetical protein